MHLFYGAPPSLNSKQDILLETPGLKIHVLAKLFQ